MTPAERKRLAEERKAAPFSIIVAAPEAESDEELEPWGVRVAPFVATGGCAYMLRGAVDLRIIDDIAQLTIAKLQVVPNPLWAEDFEAGRAPGISSTLLRGIRTQKILAEVKRQIAERPALYAFVDKATDGRLTELWDGPNKWAHGRSRAEWIAKKLDNPLLRGRGGYPQDFYRLICAQYFDLQDQGVTRGIKERIAAAESDRRGSPVTANDVKGYLAKSRTLGLIVFEKRGRIGAMPGPRWEEEAES